MIAVVGTRRPSGVGLEVATRMARSLAEAGAVVVSGMAVGIDGAAHRAALEAGGRTVAVLGCGLDVDYPRKNRALRQAVARAGTLVTEYPPGTPPLKQHFPQRNRIIAGLSHGVIVIEGAITSGALVTARLALDCDRNVYALPGSVANPMAAGPNELLRTSQAALVTSINHVFEDLAPLLRFESEAGSDEDPGAGLPEEQRAVLRALDDSPTPQEALAGRVQLEPGRLAIALAMLEAKGLAVRGYGGYAASGRVLPR